MSHNLLDISEVVKASGLSVSTLRYYEKKELITSACRAGLRRQYAANVLQRLSLISLAKNAGFTLKEIKDLLTNNNGKIDRDALMLKAMELENSIKQLQAMYRGLLHAANCPEEDQLDCPKFQQILRIATKKQRLKSQRQPYK